MDRRAQEDLVIIEKDSRSSTIVLIGGRVMRVDCWIGGSAALLIPALSVLFELVLLPPLRPGNCNSSGLAALLPTACACIPDSPIPCCRAVHPLRGFAQPFATVLSQMLFFFVSPDSCRPEKLVSYPDCLGERCTAEPDALP